MISTRVPTPTAPCATRRGTGIPRRRSNKAPNCFSCKFPTDKEVRISPMAPLIAEADWKKIDCTVCHPAMGPGRRLPSGTTARRRMMPSRPRLSYAASATLTAWPAPSTRSSLGGGAHSNQIGTTKKRPSECTDCHTLHTMKADCKTCHADCLCCRQEDSGTRCRPCQGHVHGLPRRLRRQGGTG